MTHPSSPPPPPGDPGPPRAEAPARPAGPPPADGSAETPRPQAGRPTSVIAVNLHDVAATIQPPAAPPTLFPARPGAMPALGEEFLGFRLVEELGSGAFARVFLAHQRGLADRPVALKISTRPTAEPQRLAKLRHTNVVPIHSVHDAPPLQAVCMPFLGRRTLADVLRNYQSSQNRSSRRTRLLAGALSRLSVATGVARPAPPAPAPTAAPPAVPPLAGRTHAERVTRVILAVARGLEHAHGQNILHLDIKPANVLLADDGEPLLLDFNLSHDTGGRQRGLAGGTLPYMAPEQLLDFARPGSAPIDARTDLFSLGVLFYELLTGRHPFPVPEGGRPDPESLAEQRRAGAPPIRRAKPRLDPALASVVHKLLEPDPARRYRSAADLADDLARHLADRPLAHAPNPSPLELARKWRRRHPRAAPALLALALAATATSIVAFAYARAQSAALEVRRAREAALESALPTLRIDLADPDSPALRAKALALADARLGDLGVPGLAPLDAARLGAIPPEGRAALAELERLCALALWLDGRSQRPPDPKSAGAGLARLALARQLDPAPEGRAAAELGRDLARLAGPVAAPTPPLPPPGVAEPGAAELYLAAARDLAASRPADAAAHLARLVARDPMHSAAQYQLGQCRAALGEASSALEHYYLAKILSPADARAPYRRAALLLVTQRVAPALAELDEAILRAPALEDAYRLRAALRASQGRGEAALSDCDRALVAQPDSVALRLLRADLLGRLGRGGEAATERERALKLTPAGAEDLVAAGLARRGTDALGAILDARRAAEAGAKSFAAWQNLAALYSRQMRRPDLALAAMHRAVACAPENPVGRVSRAVLYAELGNAAAARDDLGAALDSSDDPQVIYAAACALALIAATDDDFAECADTLTLAVRRGFSDWPQLESDPHLVAFRARPEYQRFAEAARALGGAPP